MYVTTQCTVEFGRLLFSIFYNILHFIVPMIILNIEIY